MFTKYVILKLSVIVVLLTNNLFSETIVNWNSKEYDCDLTSINNQDEKIHCYKKIKDALLKDYFENQFEKFEEVYTRDKFRKEAFPEIKKMYNKGMLEFHKRADLLKSYLDSQTSETITPEEYYRQKLNDKNFRNTFPRKRDWLNYTEQFPTVELANNYIKRFDIKEDEAYKVWYKNFAMKELKEKWLLERLSKVHPDIREKLSPESFKKILSNKERYSKLNKEEISDLAENYYDQTISALCEREVMKTIFPELQFKNDKWKKVFDEKLGELLKMPTIPRQENVR